MYIHTARQKHTKMCDEYTLMYIHTARQKHTKMCDGIL